MSSAPRRRAGAKVAPVQIDAVMRASRALVGIAAASVAEVDDTVTVPQLRVLMMLATCGPLNMAAVGEGLQVSPSNASRICERLLRAGFLDRRDDPGDRRNVVLSLTQPGQALIDKVIEHRRSSISHVLRKMDVDDRAQLADALERFADAAGEPLDLTLI